MTLIFFVLFIIIGNASGSDFKRAPPAEEVTDIDVIIEKSLEVGDLWDVLNKIYSKSSFRISAGGLILNILQVNANSELLNDTFISWSHNYASKLMLEYCELAVRIIEENKNTNAIRFSSDYKYCMLAAFADKGLYVGLLFESTFFLQTIHQDDFKSPKALKNQLLGYIRDYNLTQYMLHPKAESKNLLSKIENIKKEFTDHANLYCEYWRPIVSNVFHTKTLLDDIRDYSRFIHYVFQNEKCLISFQKISSREITGSYSVLDITKYMKRMINRITSWDCNNILENEQYRLQKYKKDIQPYRKKSKIEKVNIITPSKPIILNAPQAPYQANYELSLAELKHELKSNIFYLNAVKYYEIVSNVMLYVSIKEGNKLLTGTVHEIQRKCGEKNEIANGVLRGLKQKLLLFKHFFGKIFFLILREHRIDVTDDVHKKKFDLRLNTFVNFLEMSKNDNNNNNNNNKASEMQRICNAFRLLLDTVDELYYTPDVLNYEGFHLNEPIFNVVELHHFVRNNFL